MNRNLIFIKCFLFLLLFFSMIPFAQTEGEKLIGKVVEVVGTDVKIKLETSGSPDIGDRVDLTYVAANDKELPVGIWKVKSVSDNIVMAEKDSSEIDPRVGLKATIYKEVRNTSNEEEGSFWTPPPPPEKEFSEEDIEALRKILADE